MKRFKNAKEYQAAVKLCTTYRAALKGDDLNEGVRTYLSEKFVALEHATADFERRMTMPGR